MSITLPGNVRKTKFVGENTYALKNAYNAVKWTKCLCFKERTEEEIYEKKESVNSQSCSTLCNFMDCNP